MSDTNSISTTGFGHRRLREVQAEATRSALLDAAQACFVRRGFALTTLDDITQAAGVTKGAMYHHFRDKKALFRAVYEGLSQELVGDIAADETAAGSSLDAALRAFLVRAADERFRTVLFTDGPVVLGVEDCRAIDERYPLELLTRLMSTHLSPRVLGQVDGRLLATMMLALVIEAGRVLAVSAVREGGPLTTAVQLEFLLGRMIKALQDDGP